MERGKGERRGEEGNGRDRPFRKFLDPPLRRRAKSVCDTDLFSVERIAVRN